MQQMQEVAPSVDPGRQAMLQPEIAQALAALVQQQIAGGGGDVRQNPEWQRLRPQYEGPNPPIEVALRDLMTRVSRGFGARAANAPAPATGLELHRQQVNEAEQQAGSR